MINRVPVYPTIGNHDAGETESRDDREQLIDNFYINERIAAKRRPDERRSIRDSFTGFASTSDVEFICIDTSKEPAVFKKRLFDHPKHQEFLNSALPVATPGQNPTWRIPFCHHPPFCAGPAHHNTDGMGDIIKRFEKAGVKLVLSGHEHQFQHSRANGIDYLVTGGAGQLRTKTPDKFTKAKTISWAAAYHFLLVTVDGKRTTVRALGQFGDRGGMWIILEKGPPPNHRQRRELFYLPGVGGRDDGAAPTSEANLITGGGVDPVGIGFGGWDRCLGVILVQMRGGD